jgi:uncharacterized protein YlzI (FlbEa/FlbD family)
VVASSRGSPPVSRRVADLTILRSEHAGADRSRLLPVLAARYRSSSRRDNNESAPLPMLCLTSANPPNDAVVVASDQLASIVARQPNVTYIRLTDGRTVLVRESLVEILDRLRAAARLT